MVRDRDGREWPGQLVDEGHVVEADDAEVVRAASAALGEDVVAAQGDQVVAGYHGGEPCTRLEQGAQPGGSRLFFPRPAVVPQVWVEIQSVLLDRDSERPGAGDASGGVGRPGEVGDAGVAEFCKVAYSQVDSRRVVGRHRGGAGEEGETVMTSPETTPGAVTIDPVGPEMLRITGVVAGYVGGDVL